MKIIPHGKIFDPTDHALSNGCHEFAQSPQAIVFDDYVRIYFSTRSVDPGGKYISHALYADFDKTLQNILSVATEPVIAPAQLGAFDEHGIFPFHVMRHGEKIFAYTTGWSRRVSVSVETGIGLAISEDRGTSFTRIGSGPVLTASVHEPFLVGDAFVRYFEERFHMWYIFGQKWKQFPDSPNLERVYKIGHVTSKDGVTWGPGSGLQIIPDTLSSDESQALPSVVKSGDSYHLFFCYRESVDFRKTPGRGYRLGYAKSSDLKSWHRHDELLEMERHLSDWDQNMQCYPHIFECDGRTFLLYNGNEFGRFGFGAAEVIL